MHSFLKIFFYIAFMLLASSVQGQTVHKLSGTPYGTLANRTLKIENAFDDDLMTYYSSSQKSNAWVGLDLGTPHRITQVAWAARNSNYGPRQCRLAVFEGANREDFLDAIPLYMTTEDGKKGMLNYADVNVTRSFRYVRYVGPGESGCNIAEVEFYGYEISNDIIPADDENGLNGSVSGLTDDDTEQTEAEVFYRPTNLPLVVVHVKDAQEPYDKENQLEMIATIISADGTENLSQPGTIRLRGNGSMTFPKKPYRLKFDTKQRVLDAPAKAKKWTLINNYGDKTLMRNILAFDLSQRLGFEYTPYCTSVDVMVNGEYKGNYQLCDQVEVAKNRLAIDEMDATCVEGESLTGGYFIEVDAYAYEETSCFSSNKGTPVTIKSPSDDEIQPVQSEYIRNVFNKMEARVYGYMPGSVNDYRNYLDIETFLKHFIVGEFAGNTDTYWSTFMYKRRGDDMLYVGPVWDFDLAYENDGRTYPINTLDDYIYAVCGSYAGDMRSFVNHIIKDDPRTLRDLENMWAQLRETGVISDAELMDVIDRHEENLNESQQLNFKRWDIMNSIVHQNPVVWGSYKAEVDNVRNYVKDRIAWFDRKLNYTPTAIHDASLLRDSDEDAHSLPYTLYTSSGMMLGRYQSISDAREALGHGMFIISQRGKHSKVVF